MRLSDIPAAFEAYADTFPAEDMNLLKRDHTRRVAANARAIMDGEAFPPRLRPLGEAAAWLHDLGRFRQYTQYQTFSDRVSVNHALLSCAELLRLGWLDDADAPTRNAILRAIECHNLRDLPPHLPADELALAHLVRDADKLDIYTVLDHAIETDYLPTHPDVYWGLPLDGPPSPKVLAALERGDSVDYADIASFADFVFIQLAWCNGGLHYRASRRLALERGEVEIRRRYLLSLIPAHAAAVERACAIAARALTS